MRINVRGGTAKFGEPSLCETCRHSFIVAGPTKEIRRCHSAPGNMEIDFRVERCTDYLRQTQSTLYEMKQMAWLLDSKKKGTVGFVKPRDLSKELKDELHDIED